MPRYGWVILILIIGFGGWRWYSGTAQAETELGWEPFTVDLGSLKDSIPCDGTLEPDSRTEIKSRVAGEIVEMFVEEGDKVIAGQVIAQLDTEELIQEVRQAEANLQASQANYSLAARGYSPTEKLNRQTNVAEAQLRFDQADAEYQRIKGLNEQGFASAQDLENAETARDLARSDLELSKELLATAEAGGEPEDKQVAQAQIIRNRAILETAQEELANATIRAPVGGTLLSLPVEVGTTVSSGISANSGGTVVAVIGDMDRMVMEGTVDEADVGRVTAGMTCEIFTDAYPTLSFEGTVLKIAPQATVNSNVSTFKVEIAVDTENPTVDKSRQRNQFMGTFAGSKGGGKRPGGGGPPSGPSGADMKDVIPEETEAPKPVLRAGMTSTAEIIVSSYEEAPIIPLRYLKFDEEGQPYVLKWPDGEPLPVDPEQAEESDEEATSPEVEPIKTVVEIGYTDGVSYALSKGLAPGDVIVAEVEWIIEAEWGAFGLKQKKTKK